MHHTSRVWMFHGLLKVAIRLKPKVFTEVGSGKGGCVNPETALPYPPVCITGSEIIGPPVIQALKSSARYSEIVISMLVQGSRSSKADEMLFCKGYKKIVQEYVCNFKMDIVMLDILENRVREITMLDQEMNIVPSSWLAYLEQFILKPMWYLNASRTTLFIFLL
ncbi:uncharacterized protein EV154DRAFT_478801 [Mucor mucedo]|uniref:uncharacterized protein n=1 Tax=Mucor mucedo TaxID=29922 RepID=UPI0022201BC1|nr:uncharacterized protein EV154DRAFT_478801 [Mucor mucedo]KAI7894008.1 hypothetical protein EV154DRAFT_478801 [Mucor mucedo]